MPVEATPVNEHFEDNSNATVEPQNATDVQDAPQNATDVQDAPQSAQKRASGGQQGQAAQKAPRARRFVGAARSASQRAAAQGTTACADRECF